MYRFVLAVALVGCASDPEPITTAEVEIADGAWASADRTAPARLSFVDPRHPLGSAVMIEDRLGTALYSVDSEHGTVVRFDRTTFETETLEVGAGAARISRAGDDLFVSLRGERSVVKLLADGSRIVQHVGAEPIGILARPDGDRVYVAVSQEDVVLELDGETLEVLARVPVREEPRFLALHPSGQVLFVGSARGAGGLERIDLGLLSVAPIELPNKSRIGAEIPMVARVTGDLAVRGSGITRDGMTLAVPVLYADVESPIQELGSIEEAFSSVVVGGPTPGMPDQGAYGGGTPEPDVDDNQFSIESSRLVPAVVAIELNPSGRPLGSLAYPIAVAYRTGNRVDRVMAYPTSAAYHGDHELAVTLEAEDAVVVFDTRHLIDNGFAVSLAEGGFDSRAAAIGWAGDAVGGAVWTADDHLYSIGTHDHDLAEHPLAPLRSIVTQNAGNGRNLSNPGVAADVRVQLAPVDLDPVLAEGRSLFFSASDRRIGGGGVSCSSCHFDGRDDGMTWTFESGVRQTPSLAGVVSATAPVTWTSAVPTVAEEASITALARMGGAGLDVTESELVARFVDSTPLPDRPDVQDPAAVERGAWVFEEFGCATCHEGAAFTDGSHHAFEPGVIGSNTPTLLGIAATAPYLSDGRASTLRQVLVLAKRPGEMGSTAGASDAQLDDLEAYLRSL